MPIVWRYLLGQYLQIFFISLSAIITILLTTRLDEIAHFAGLGAQPDQIGLFILYQLPYILPIAIPISALISSVIVLKKISASHELTALRACGVSLIEALLPMLIAATFLTFINFYILSELATQSHLKSNALKSELRSVNPILLLKNKHLMRMKGVFFEGLGDSRTGEYINDAIIAVPNKNTDRMNLMIAKKIEAHDDLFKGSGMSFLTTSAQTGQGFEPLIVENMRESNSQINAFSELINKKISALTNDSLKLPLLYNHIKEIKRELDSEPSGDKIKELKKELSKAFSEIVRRASGSFSVFAFTLLGAAFAMRIGRNRSSKGLAISIGLATFYLICFFIAKGFDHIFVLSLCLYTIPLILISLFSAWRLRQISRGIDS